MEKNSLNLPLALGIGCVLMGLQAMFGMHNSVMGWVGIGVGTWLIALVIWKVLTKKKPSA